eukprot:c12198_g1_i3.p1 GENE.c12198_g1_i3~~c12198_g1_i3.p1  ORF type:complete len:456 (+),score=56.14 c12198_g1_i3:70-1437(+)
MGRVGAEFILLFALAGLCLAATKPTQEPECFANCFRRGFCVNGTCHCANGWSGEFCDQKVPWCPNNCNGHGACNVKTFECDCFAGFTGPDCSNVAQGDCLNSCMGHGFCDPETKKCICSLGFSGPDCSVVESPCPSNCSAQGRCVYGRCRCDPGFAPPDCSVFSNSNACPDGCSGHGRCVENRCECEPGFGGSSCSEILDLPTNGAYGCPGRCSGHGVCVRGICRCSAGWTGSKCDQTRNDCPKRCSGHGACGESQKCECFKGFDGPACDTVIGGACPEDCNALGACYTNVLWNFLGVEPVCQCFDSSRTVGRSCALQPLANTSKLCPQRCNGNGVCQDGVCKCSPDFTGPSCSTAVFDCPMNCSGNGLCVEHKCSCNSGYRGLACNEQVAATHVMSYRIVMSAYRYCSIIATFDFKGLSPIRYSEFWNWGIDTRLFWIGQMCHVNKTKQKSCEV